MTYHSILYFFARAGSGLLSVATLAALTRLLTPTEYGLYALGVTVASIASTVLFQWLNISIGRFYPAFLDRPGVLIGASKRGFRLAASAVLLVLLALVPLRRLIGVSMPLMVAVFIATVALARFNLLLQVANAQGRPLRYALLTWCKAFVALVAGSSLILLGANHLGALYGFVLGHILAALAVNPLRGIRAVSSHEARALSPKLLRYGLPLMFTLVGTTAVDFADRLLIGWILGPSRVGPYAAAYDLSTQTIGAVTNIVFLAAFPAVMHAFEHQGEDAARDHMRSLGRALIAVGLPATVGFSVLSGEIANMFLGASFRGEVAGIMALLAASLWLAGFKSYYLDAIFQLCRVTGYQARIALMMMALNVVLNLILLPPYGIVGAAWATFAAFALGALLSFFLGRARMRLLSIGSDFLKACAACGLMAVAIAAFPSTSGLASLLLKVVTGASIYLAAAWFLDLAATRTWLSERLAWAGKRA